MPSVDSSEIIVTGASQGMGLEMSRRFAQEGASVTLVSRNEAKLKRAAQTIDGDPLVLPGDVRNRADVEEIIQTVYEERGRIDTLVNNAGVSLLTIADGHRRVTEVTETEWDTVIDTNLKGAFLFSKFALERMQAQQHGNIINISSGLGRRAAANWQPYLTSKWGIEGFTRSVALEFEADGININGLDPGGGVITWKENRPKSRHDDLLPPDIMNEAAVLLAAQPVHGITGESMTATEWERRFAEEAP